MSEEGPLGADDSDTETSRRTEHPQALDPVVTNDVAAGAVWPPLPTPSDPVLPVVPRGAESTASDLFGVGDVQSTHSLPVPTGGASLLKKRISTGRLLLFVVIAVALALCVRFFCIGLYVIPSGSMEPTLVPGDTVLVVDSGVDPSSISRGDIIVFKKPPNTVCSGSAAYYIKRVVALPGDTISSKGPYVFVNKKAVLAKWSIDTPLGRPIPLTHLGPHQYYVLGDNRTESCDSRYWGPVPDDTIIGRAVAIIAPGHDATWLGNL